MLYTTQGKFLGFILTVVYVPDSLQYILCMIQLIVNKLQFMIILLQLM